MNKKQRNLKKKQQRARTKAASPQGGNGHIKMTGSSTYQRMPLWTTTGELFQPVRIYYDMLKLRKFSRCFTNCAVWNFDPRHERWTWFYTAKRIKLPSKKSLSIQRNRLY